jgi:protein ImuB
MSRLACLLLPDLPLQAALRAEPDLAGAPLAITEGGGPRALIRCASPAARAAGARPGMTATQATAAAGRLVLRGRSEAAERSVADALLDVARAFAARVERTRPDLVLLEVGDLGRLYPSETALAAAMEAAARKAGLAVRLGIAGSKAVARLAAASAPDGGVAIVPPGEERAFLAPLPVALAEPDEELAESLARFGLRTLGDVAALPGDALGRRLGREGVALWRRARGEDDEALRPDPEPASFVEAVDLDWAVDTSEPLAFVLSGVFSRLCARLEVRGLACAGISLSLRLAPRGAEARDLAVAAPTTEGAVLVTLARLSLEERPPPAPVRGVAAAARTAPARPMQLPLFGPVLPPPDRLAATVAKLAARFGADRVGAPAIVDSHRPEAAGLAPFDPLPLLDPAAFVPPRPLALCRIVPPRAVKVRLSDAHPVAVGGERLRRAAGPWRLQGEWWAAPWDRDYYDVETAGGALLRIFRDRATGAWYTDGVYD